MKVVKKRLLTIGLGGGLYSGISGGAVRFCEWLRDIVTSEEFMIDILATSGGRKMIENYFEDDKKLLSQLKFINVKASLFLKKEPFPIYRVWSYIVSYIHVLFLLKKLGHYDIGYSPSNFFYHVIPLKKMKQKGKIKKLYSAIYHRIPNPKSRKGLFVMNWLIYAQQQEIFKELSVCADGLIISNTEEGYKIGSYFKDKLLYQGKLLYVDLGIHLDFIKSIPASTQRFDFIHIGMRPNKGVFDLPVILQAVIQQYPEMKLGLIGKSSMQLDQSLKARFQEAGILENVEFLGMLSESEKISLLKAARLFLAASHEEGWGLAVGEALASGTPVVGYDLPAYKSAFGDAVKYVESFDMEAFSVSVIELLNNQKDYQHYVKKGLEKMEEYDWPKLFSEERKMLLED